MTTELEPLPDNERDLLQAFSEARDLIARSEDLDELREIRDRAIAWQQYMRAKGYGKHFADKGTEIRLRSERRMGALIPEQVRPGGDRKSSSRAESLKLSDLGVDHNQSHRWQKLAAVPEKVFEEYVKDVADDPEAEMTSAGLRLHAARQRTPDPVSEPVPLPCGKFSCIVADPPWSMRLIEREQRPDQGRHVAYPTMEIDEIAKLPVAELAADDCHLYLWVTHRFLPAGLQLLEEWGFAYQCVMTWRKNVGFTPFSWMYDTEHVLFARRGNLKMTQLGLRLSFEAPVAGHSVKPDVFYERVIAASPGPRLEMFARRQRDGFTAWGNEVSNAAI